MSPQVVYADTGPVPVPATVPDQGSIVVVIVPIACVILVALGVVYRIRKNQTQSVSKELLFSEPPPPRPIFVDFGSPVVWSPAVQLNPMLQPDSVDDAVNIFEILQVRDADSFETMVDHVKGTPMYGTMMQMDGAQREEFMVRLRHVGPTAPKQSPEPEGDQNIKNAIASLRKVHRPSLA